MTSTTRSRSIAKRPKDARARERLREAQAAETLAVAAYYAATEARAAVEAVIKEADEKVDAARALVVSVSGLPRAVLLLGEKPAALRRAVAARPGTDSGPDGEAA
jgi:anti-sigma factor RsiW